MKRPTELLDDARQVYRTRGMTHLLRRAVPFIGYCLFRYRCYRLYCELVPAYPDLSEADFLPRITGFTRKVVSSNEEADELEAQGFEFRSLVPEARQRLDRGATALCIFVGSELGNVTWVATTQEARDCIGEPPYRTDFANHESCWGGTWTSPKYRRLGLHRYARFKMDEFLLSRNVVKNRSAIPKSSIASARSRPEHFPPPYAEGRYLRILWWESWREKPLTLDSDREQ